MNVQPVVDKLILLAHLHWKPSPGKPGELLNKLSSEERELLKQAKPNILTFV